MTGYIKRFSYCRDIVSFECRNLRLIGDPLMILLWKLRLRDMPDIGSS